MDKSMKLTMELVPTTSHYDNLRKRIPKAEWDRIRKKVYADYGHKCGICGSEGRLNCHEIWEYDDEKHIQRLRGFIALCDLCHHVKHFALSTILAEQGKLDIERVIEHFMKLNNCSVKDFESYVREVDEKLKERSKYQWHVDLGEYRNIVQ